VRRLFVPPLSAYARRATPSKRRSTFNLAPVGKGAQWTFGEFTMSEHGFDDLVHEVKQMRDLLALRGAVREAVIDNLKNDFATHSKTSTDTQAKLQQVRDDVQQAFDLHRRQMACFDDLAERIARLESALGLTAPRR
jgi:hypothetical protein